MTLAIALQNDSTSLVLFSDGWLPEVVHWGAPLGELDADAVATLRAVAQPPVAGNGIPEEHGHRLSILPEQWASWTGHPGISGSRQGSGWAPRFQLHRTTLDGQIVNGFATAEQGTVVFEAKDPDAGLALGLTIELTPEGLVRVRTELTNTGADGYQLNQLVVCLPVPSRATEVLDFAGRWGKERYPQRSTLGIGTHWREGRHGRTGADSAFVLHLGTPGFGFQGGEVWSVHTAWSGNHVHYAEKILTGDQVVGGGELPLPGEVVLDKGASYTSPWVVFNHGAGLDQIARNHHAFLRRTHPLQGERPVTLNVWEAVYFDHDADRLKDLAHRSAEVGIERYVLDDGWFGARRDDHAGLGDWVVSNDIWPDGLHPLVDEVTGLGMQFGLWFEPEMVNPDSDLARSHPEWVMQVPGRMPLESRHQWLLNIGIPGAYEHVKSQINALLDEYAISYIKWDHNRDVVDGGTTPDGRPGVHEQTLAFYRMVDELKAAHPGLEIESCSSGGARIDLGVMEHCDRVWVSDNIDPTDRQQMMRWTAQLLPPELLGSHIASGASHTTGRMHDIGYRAATAVFGHLGVEWDLAKATDDEIAQLSAWIAWYKEHRTTLLGGQIVRVDLPQPGSFLHGVVTPRQAVFAYTELELAPVWSPGMVPLPGLVADATYRVTHLDLTAHGMTLPEPVELTGCQLAQRGIRAPRVNPERTRILVVDRVRSGQ
ncbi:alpha-galactosidase [Luteococcus sanguinis]|uniref:alpha-galactosidase n=1 Tax=Luteococcus sanguinis TaxID=174038 RepID=A0ABW1X204_9ACTN